MPSKLKANYIRFTDDEYAQLTQKANQANLSLSRYLIESGLSFSVNSLSPYLREHIEQIKFESALLQHHLDLLLNKKSYIEQLASLGELDNLISFLSFSAKSLHDIFLADSNQNKINQFISNHNEINHNYSSNCSNCHQLNNALLNNNSLINEQLNHQQLNQLNATSSINHLSINNQLNSHQPNTDLSISQQLNNNPANNTQLDNSQLHNNPLNDDLLNNIQIVTSNCSSDTLSNDSLSNNNSDISHNSNSDHSDNDNSDNDNPFNLFIASGISDNKANKPTISFFCNSNIVVVGLNNSFSTYSPISLISYYFYLDEDIPISFVFLSSCYPVFINQFSSAQILEAPHNEDSVFDCPIVDTPVFEIPFIEISTADISVTGTPFIDASLIEAPIVDSSVVEVIENSPNSAFTDSSIIASINENLIFDISFSQNLISQNLISQNSSATTLALSPISDIAAPTNIAAPTANKEVKELNQLNILSSSSCQNIQDINIAQNIYFVSQVNLDPNLDLRADANEANLDSACNLDANSALGIENYLDFDIESLPDPDLAPFQFHIIDDRSIDPNLIVSIPSHLLYPQDHSYSYDDTQDLDDPPNLEHFNQINSSSPIHQLNNNVTVLDNNLINQPLQSHNHHSEVLKLDDINQVLENNPTNSNSNFSDLISSLSDNNCSSPRHSNIADLNPSHSNNKDFP